MGVMESPVNLVNPSEPLPISTRSPAERLFPTLTDAQVARIAPHGQRRTVAAGEVLIDVGQKPAPFFVVTSGALQVVRPDAAAGDRLIVTHRHGQFTGETNMLTGRRSLARLRVGGAGEVIEVSRDELLRLIQSDAELSEILMRAFLLRRAS